MAASAYYQRSTGPTHPLRGTAEAEGQQFSYRLPRSAVNEQDAKLTIPDPGASARVLWRRYPTNELFTVVFMAPETDGDKKILTARIPAQPAAGKVEYKIEFANSSLPSGGDTVIMRFRGAVPPLLLLSHVLIIFAAMLASTRAGLGAAFGRTEKRIPWVTLGLILVGGLALGASVQKAAFGAYWTGWPFGSDLTDNKTLVMFIAWLLACSLMSFSKIRRTALVLASFITIVVYLIPHSLRGSEFDYQQGVVQTGQRAT